MTMFALNNALTFPAAGAEFMAQRGTCQL